MIQNECILNILFSNAKIKKNLGQTIIIQDIVSLM